MKNMNKKRKVRKTSVLFLFCLLLFVFVGIPFTILKLTEDQTYYVENLKTSEVVSKYKHYLFARLKMDSIDSKYICIKNQKGKVYRLKSGVVNLNTKSITQNTEYTTDTNEKGYTNGHYGADAQYLGTSFDGKKVHFKISGVSCWTDINNVQLYLYSDSLTLSSYYVYNGELMHTISTDILQGDCNSIAIGPAPKFMKENTLYFSYDGHFFYTSYNKLVQDKKVNKKPYYNYYQYVPHRTTSYLNNESYDHYLYRYGIDTLAKVYPCQDDESSLYDQAQVFLDYQNKYSINASMMYALALNESGLGKSQYSIEYHNLFGHAALDANPDQANQYNSLSQCIKQHAYNFLQQVYCNPKDSRYHGSWFGDKASGINVSYASDPYWGEKAASFYYHLDSERVDKNKNPIQTTKLTNDLNVYDKDKKTILYSFKKESIVSIHVLEKKHGWYKIASEAPIKNNKIQVKKRYKNDIAYIKVSDFD